MGGLFLEIAYHSLNFPYNLIETYVHIGNKNRETLDNLKLKI